MSRRSLSMRISPDLDLHEIKIRLQRFGPPQVELHGEVTGLRNRRVEASTRAVVHTLFLPPEGERFIEAMREALAAEKAPTSE